MAANICINCKNSSGFCAWSANLKPVEGWTAKPIKKRTSDGKTVDSYYITDCPKFEAEQRPKNNKEWTCQETVLLKQMLKQKIRHKKIAEVLNRPLNTVEHKIYILRKGKRK